MVFFSDLGDFLGEVVSTSSSEELSSSSFCEGIEIKKVDVKKENLNLYLVYFFESLQGDLGDILEKKKERSRPLVSFSGGGSLQHQPASSRNDGEESSIFIIFSAINKFAKYNLWI